jgi:hypothetical protein
VTRSTDLIDAKAFEADFFLGKLTEAGPDFVAARCYFSAFVSAARSITFAMQAVLKDVDGFSTWYTNKQKYLRNIPAARFFSEIRNETQKIGHTPLNSGESRWRSDGPPKVTYYFSGGFEGDPSIVPDADVVTACREHLTRLVQLVYDCYLALNISSPQSFFSVPNLLERDFLVAEIEEALGFPRGWTNAPGLTTADRLATLQRQSPDTAIDRLFLRYLGHARPDPAPGE